MDTFARDILNLYYCLFVNCPDPFISAFHSPQYDRFFIANRGRLCRPVDSLLHVIYDVSCTVGHQRQMACLSTVKAFYISHSVLLDNEESFSKVNSSSNLAPLFFQGYMTVMLHCILNSAIQLSSYNLTREHQLYIRPSP